MSLFPFIGSAYSEALTRCESRLATSTRLDQLLAYRENELMLLLISIFKRICSSRSRLNSRARSQLHCSKLDCSDIHRSQLVYSQMHSSGLQLMKPAFMVLLAVTILLAPRVADARRHRHHSRKKHAAIINEKKLYERIGGKQVLNDITDDWVRNGLSDERIASLFQDFKTNPSQLAKFRKALNEQLCEIADGPCQYNGPDLKKLKTGAKFDDWHIVAFSDDLFRALEKRSIGEREKNELLGRAGWLRADLLGLPSRPSPMPN